jgi:hypothetical protein
MTQLQPPPLLLHHNFHSQKQSNVVVSSPQPGHVELLSVAFYFTSLVLSSDPDLLILSNIFPLNYAAECKRLTEEIGFMTFKILEQMKKYFGLTEVEVVHGIFLIRKGSFGKWRSEKSSLSVENCIVLFVAGMLIAHKHFGDDQVKNKYWSDLFKIPLTRLNKGEITLLKACRFETFISKEECLQTIEAIKTTLHQYHSHSNSSILPSSPSP